MCGIVGLYLKNPTLENKLGEMFAPMLESMSERGPDSAGFAIYSEKDSKQPVKKFALRSESNDYDWLSLAEKIKEHFGISVDFKKNQSIAIFNLTIDEEVFSSFLQNIDEEIVILSAGESIEIYKAVGLPKIIIDDYQLTKLTGSHIIGHTRMATESAVTMAGSHPFSTGEDLCLVHNGSLSNHNRLRLMLQKNGIEFSTENDTEVAAAYLTWRLQVGDSLEQALYKALIDLDGFYTFAIGTRKGFAVLRDPIACKPAVMAETDDYVAMASEFRALSNLPNIENAKVWEPEPATVYVWER